MDSVTHIAGIPIHVGSRIIQRCAVCGLKLCDNLNVAVPEYPGSKPYHFPTWEAGGLVEQDGYSWRAVHHVDGNPLPSNNCFALVEE